jgi:phospholipid-binding lipoprotein MlaA
MKLFQTLALVAIALSISACASRAGNSRADREVSSVVVAADIAQSITSDAVMSTASGGESVSSDIDERTIVEFAPATTDTPTSAASNQAVDGEGKAIVDMAATNSYDMHEASDAELDAAVLYADDVVRDPWERYNRRIDRFNNAVDRNVLRPLAIGYTKAVPRPVRSGVSRVLSNLGTPATAVNQLLQGRPAHAVQSLGRFAVNTTVGVGGVFDPATRLKIPQHSDEDFGQTLAIWGWRDSRYLVLPLLGPRTVRDSFAMVGDRLLSPSGYVNDARTVSAMQLLEVVDTRAQLLPLDEAREEAYDEYVLIRDAWAQRRNFQIEDAPKDGSD